MAKRAGSIGTFGCTSESSIVACPVVQVIVVLNGIFTPRTSRPESPPCRNGRRLSAYEDAHRTPMVPWVVRGSTWSDKPLIWRKCALWEFLQGALHDAVAR